MSTKISGDTGIDVAQLRPADGDPVAITIAADGKVTIDPATLILKNPVALGYGNGAGGVVTQLTSKSTPVTLDKPCGIITMHNAALAAGASAFFEFNNSLIDALCALSITATNVPSNGFNYTVTCQSVVAGKAFIRVTNVSAGSLSDAVQISFGIIKVALT